MTDEPVEVRDEPDRYAAYVGGRRAGTLTLLVRAGRLVLVHTEVDPAFEGRGVGSALARHGIEDARRRGLRLHPVCPFVRAYLERHPDLAGAPERRRRARRPGPGQE